MPRGGPISVLHECGAIRDCEQHGWMQYRADTHAHGRACEIARHDPPLGLSPAAAVAEVRGFLEGLGETCPGCPKGDC
jgi:hypothetical protein